MTDWLIGEYEGSVIADGGVRLGGEGCRYSSMCVVGENEPSMNSR